MRTNFRKFAFFVAATAISISLASLSIDAGPGDLDTSFGIQGQVSDPTLSSITKSVVQADGKIVVVGMTRVHTSNGFYSVPGVARYNVDGSLDAGFGGGGLYADDAHGTFNSVLLQSDGKIVAVGKANGDFFAARLNTNGTLDTSFSNDGKWTFSFNSGDGWSDDAIDVALIPGTDKILVAGVATYSNGVSDIALVRINANGTLDTTFGFYGIRTINVMDYDYIRSMAIHPFNKKIALALNSSNPGTGSDFGVAMLNENGLLDTNFGNSGVVTTDFYGNNDEANCIAFQTWWTFSGTSAFLQSRVVVGGRTYSSATTDQDFALARYKMNGTLDTAFDGDGKVRKALSYARDEIMAMSIDSSGRIVTAGRRFWNVNWHFALVRFERDGYFDPGFGTQGKVYTLFYSGGVQADAEARALALAPDGKIVVAGYSPSGDIFGQVPMLLARYEP